MIFDATLSVLESRKTAEIRSILLTYKLWFAYWELKVVRIKLELELSVMAKYPSLYIY